MKFLQVACLAALLCGVAWSASPFSVQISMQPEYNIGSDVICSIVITNLEDQDYHLLQRNTPLEGLKTSLFSVTHDGKRLPYDGLIFKRGAPTKMEYIQVNGKSSLTGQLDLTQAYSLHSPGTYEVKFETMLRFYKDDPANSTLQLVSSNMVTFSLTESGKQPKLTKAEALRKSENTTMLLSASTTAPRFRGTGTSSEKSATTTAFNAAYKMLSRCASNADSRSDTYVTWFGTTYSGYVDIVVGNFLDMKSALNRYTFTFYLHGPECNGEFAYTYHGSTTLYFCNTYFRAPTLPTSRSRSDTQMGTIIHELSHAVAYTEDIEYGTSDCKKLAAKYPKKAIENADNYEYFSEYLYYDQ